MVLVGIDRSPPDRPSSRFWLNPAAELTGEGLILGAKDNLVLIAYEQPSFVEVDKDDLWSGKILQRT